MGDERLMSVLIDWYWNDPVGLEPGYGPIEPPTSEAFDEMRSLLRHLRAHGYAITACAERPTEPEQNGSSTEVQP